MGLWIEQQQVPIEVNRQLYLLCVHTDPEEKRSAADLNACKLRRIVGGVQVAIVHVDHDRIANGEVFVARLVCQLRSME